MSKRMCELYVGPDKTGQLDRGAISAVFARNHDNFAIIGEAEGMWRGFAEKTLLVQVTDDEEKIYGTATELEHEHFVMLLDISDLVDF